MTCVWLRNCEITDEDLWCLIVGCCGRRIQRKEEQSMRRRGGIKDHRANEHQRQQQRDFCWYFKSFWGSEDRLYSRPGTPRPGHWQPQLSRESEWEYFLVWCFLSDMVNNFSALQNLCDLCGVYIYMYVCRWGGKRSVREWSIYKIWYRGVTRSLGKLECWMKSSTMCNPFNDK